jgi:hypothetical protein
MRLKLIFCITISFLIFSCSTKSNRNMKMAYKDSVLKQYIDHASLLPYSDESNYDYQILKAYYANDTAFLKRTSNEIAVSELKKGDGFPDSCRRHPIIEQLKADYAFQFTYEQSFCNLLYCFTITKNSDTIALQSVIYQYDDKMKSCKAAKDNSIKLTQDNWEQFINLIEYADFWGLNQSQPIHCCDGDFLTIKGIERDREDHSIIKQHKVGRQFVSNTALFKSCELLAKFSNCSLDCRF